MSVGGGEWGQRFQVQVGVAVGGAMALAIAMVIVTAMAAVVGMMATGAGATRRNQQSGAEMPPSLLHGAGDTAIPSTGHPWWRRNSLMGTLPTCLRLGSSGSSGSSAAGGLRIARAGLADQMALRVRGGATEDAGEHGWGESKDQGGPWEREWEREREREREWGEDGGGEERRTRSGSADGGNT